MTAGPVAFFFRLRRGCEKNPVPGVHPLTRFTIQPAIYFQLYISAETDLPAVKQPLQMPASFKRRFAQFRMPDHLAS